ncbi:MAG: ActS/PrrB/RegB family redox-sensitive histidine kinase [Jannaschia helgolandensis]|jgi:two-component system sensor histidine kinase RegB|uniref:histidine kinase n=1 Tax=Jannaschia helgolandensis TaxID=188906 RepID=A0A1H7FT42_9RHOB|nr:ActS/PrrB/RegB family redox-sensitive histidine kinase [Jannaschia helgolandensis]SEK29081.1 two-component system, sensor histidine kinase RegB [Jannaschia helgolandensis]
MSTQTTGSLLPPETGAPQVRLGTLVNLRWLAILGQSVTVLTGSLLLDLQFELGLCAMVIGAAAVANLMTEAMRPANTRLSDRAAFGFLLFDLIQLSALLFLTGGLHNPFAMLFLAPVTISATALSLRSTLTLGAIGAALITLLGGYYLPLRLSDGRLLELSQLQLVGFWLAILISMIFLAGFAYRLTLETERTSNALLATQTALAREQKLHDLGGVIAATAHELGTPLATIKLVSSELAEELSERPDLLEDVLLIRSQADRCRDILRSMGRAGKTDHHMRTALFETLVREAAEPHIGRGIIVTCDWAAADGSDERMPSLQRRPEVIHGLRNLIQNAVDFAQSQIWIDGRWSADEIMVRIIDDGPGYPPEMLHRLGDPFVRSRRRNGYEGMGLGLFIAKTLLERTGATLSFANGRKPGQRRPSVRSGAIAEVVWPRASLAVPKIGGLGENTPLFP